MLKISGLNINLPEKIQEAIDKRGELQALGVNFMQYQAGVAMEKAAENPSGGNLAGAGVGLGAGLGLGYGMTGAVAQGMAQQGPQMAGAPQQAQPEQKEKCPKCGEPIDKGSKFCNNCGEKIEAAAGGFCSNCGAQLAPGSKFCSECGQETA